ncbi:MAG TPA: hypothetical protein VMB50_22235 [Myxococcales bacterium]|nr:hypothetical protein [Myxococcales bacterium]
MKCLLLWLPLALCFSCAGNQPLVAAPDPRCGQPCYAGPPDVGACQLGQWACDADHQVTECEGWVAGPVCAGGVPADACARIAGACPCTPGTVRGCYDGPSGTEGVGVCHGGTQLCGPDGGWGACGGEQLPQPESCDCLDDDCNGVVDDIAPDQYCYDGPEGTAGVGICHPGVLACGSGPSCAPFCQGEQLPQPGSCAGADSACSGAPQAPADFVFVLDDTDSACASGLGVTELIQAQQTLESFAFENPQASYRYGLIVMPGCGGAWVPGPSDGGFTLEVPLGGEGQFLPAASVQCAVDPADDPACATAPFDSFDVLDAQAKGAIIPWDPAAQQRYLVLFTGAQGESREGVTAAQLPQAFAQNGVTPILFVGNGNRADYDACVAGTQGADFDLGDLPHMLAELTLSLTPACSANP